MKWVGLATLLAVAALFFAMCNEQSTDDDDSGNDDSGIDWMEKPNCGGYDFPECETAVNVPPLLLSVELLVDGSLTPMPAVVTLSSKLKLSIEFEYPGCKFTGGHVFVVKDGDPICLNGEGMPAEGGAGEIPGQCSTATVGEPYLHRAAPSLFLDSTATYAVEISNACATRSNALPLDIVVQGDDDSPDDDSPGAGADR